MILNRRNNLINTCGVQPQRLNLLTNQYQIRLFAKKDAKDKQKEKKEKEKEQVHEEFEGKDLDAIKADFSEALNVRFA